MTVMKVQKKYIGHGVNKVITHIGISTYPFATFWWFGTLLVDNMNEPARWISYEMRRQRDVDEMIYAFRSSPPVPYFVEYH